MRKTIAWGAGVPMYGGVVSSGTKKGPHDSLKCGGRLNISGVLSIEAMHDIGWLDEPPADVQPRRLIGPPR